MPWTLRRGPFLVRERDGLCELWYDDGETTPCLTATSEFGELRQVVERLTEADIAQIERERERPKDSARDR